MAPRVLIVENEILAALDVEDALVHAGYEIAGIAADRDEAVSLATGADVALVDVNLRDGPTGMDIGTELSERFGIRVMFLKANPTNVRAGVFGALGCMSKPYRPSTVCEAVRFATPKDDGARAPEKFTLFR